MKSIMVSFVLVNCFAMYSQAVELRKIKCKDISQNGVTTISFAEDYIDSRDAKELIQNASKVQVGESFCTENVQKIVYRGDGTNVSYVLGMEDEYEKGYLRIDRNISHGKSKYSVVVLQNSRMFKMNAGDTADCTVAK